MRPGVVALVRAGKAAALCAALLGATTAMADPACYGPLSPCINDDTFWPNPGPARFVGVGSAQTVAKGQLAFGLVATYLSRPIVLQVPAPGGAGTAQYAVNDQVNASFLWAYGVTRRLQLDLALPLTLIEDGSGLAPITGGAGLKDTAVRDMRFGFAYALVPHGDPSAGQPAGPFGLVARLEISAPTGDDDQFAGESSAVFAPSVAADYRAGRWFAGAEIGARIRPTSDLLSARVGTELLTTAGLGYDLLPRQLLSATVEAWVLPMLVPQGDGGYVAPAEWQVSVRTAPVGDGQVAIQASGGGPLEASPPITTPRFRFTLGVRWSP